MTGTCECANEPSGSVKCVEFLDQLRTGQLLRKDCAVWRQLTGASGKYASFMFSDLQVGDSTTVRGHVTQDRNPCGQASELRH